MNLISLKEKISTAYKNREYENTIAYIEEYISTKNLGIYGTLIYMYAASLVRTGKLDEALKCFNIIKNEWPYILNETELIESYIMCDRVDLSEELLRKNVVDIELYYNSARTYMLFGYYSLAQYWFNRCIKETDDDLILQKSKKYIKEIDNYIYNNEFVPTSYIKYKRYNKLCPGLIFYQNGGSIDDSDPKSNKRPYMVWKVENGKVYCFPVCEKKIKNEYNHILKKKNYPNSDFDRVIRDCIYCIDENKIEKIIDIVKPDDYEKVIESLYKSFCYKNETDKYGFFLEQSNKINIDIDDVILIFNSENKNRKFYIITGITDVGYCANELIKNEDGTIKRTSEEIIINRNDFIIKLYNMKPKQKQLKLSGE